MKTGAEILLSYGQQYQTTGMNTEVENYKNMAQLIDENTALAVADATKELQEKLKRHKTLHLNFIFDLHRLIGGEELLNNFPEIEAVQQQLLENEVQLRAYQVNQQIIKNQYEQQLLERDAVVEVMRDALESAREIGDEFGCGLDQAIEDALTIAPSEALRQHDEEVKEKCASMIEERWGAFTVASSVRRLEV